jgi:hypothetical protein
VANPLDAWAAPQPMKNPKQPAAESRRRQGTLSGLQITVKEGSASERHRDLLTAQPPGVTETQPPHLCVAALSQAPKASAPQLTTRATSTSTSTSTSTKHRRHRDNEPMTAGTVRGVDLRALLAAAIALVMTVVYVRVVNSQDNDPLVWVVAVLVIGALLAGYGAWRAAPHRQVVLTVAAVTLIAIGVLAILTIGVPIIVAGGLALWAAQRQA